MAQILMALGTIKFRQVYTCHNCNAQQLGETETVEVCMTNLHDWHSRVRPNCRGMPVGWTSHYAPKGDFFTCPCDNHSE